MTKAKSTQARTDQSAIYGFQDVFHGTTAIYVIEGDGYVDFFIGDYEVSALEETWKEQVRAERLWQEQAGTTPAKLPRDSLRDQVLVAFGPEVSAEQAVVALEKAIQSITAGGLLIGTDPQGSIAWEQTDGHVKV
jgi:hypothetical protein